MINILNCSDIVAYEVEAGLTRFPLLSPLAYLDYFSSGSAGSSGINLACIMY